MDDDSAAEQAAEFGHRRRSRIIERRSPPPIRLERRSPARETSRRSRQPARDGHVIYEYEFEAPRSRTRARSLSATPTRPTFTRVLHRTRDRGRSSSSASEHKRPRERPKSPGRLQAQNQDDVLDDYYGGRLSCRPSNSRPGEFKFSQIPSAVPGKPGKYGRYSHAYAEDPAHKIFAGGSGLGPPPPPRPPQPFSSHYPSDSDSDSADESDEFLASAPLKKDKLWARAATWVTLRHGHGPTATASEALEAQLSVLVLRRGVRLTGPGFRYVRGGWSDARLARTLRDQYRALKARELSLLQKLTSFRTIQFVYFLQLRAAARANGRWQVARRVPITPSDGAEARSAFMYQLRAWKGLQTRRAWTAVLDELVVEGAVVDLEIKETFDAVKIYVALLLIILLSLGVALAYGFAMGRDFATGFAIASWMVAALGFFAAVVATAEYFGFEQATARFNLGDDLENGNRLRLGTRAY